MDLRVEAAEPLREAMERSTFARMMIGLAAGNGEEKTVMIDARYLKAHRTVTSMATKRGA